MKVLMMKIVTLISVKDQIELLYTGIKQCLRNKYEALIKLMKFSTWMIG